MTPLEKDISDVINKHCAENVSNTPDFILAEYLGSCIIAFNEATNARDKWHNVEKCTRIMPEKPCKHGGRFDEMELHK